jgi:hypothetical protein
MGALTHLERRTVSRKTPNDGRLEITKRAAEKLEKIGASFDVDVAGAKAPAEIGTMECTCRGADNPHVHFFVESSLLKQLTPGSDVDLDADFDAKVVHVCKSNT